MLILADADGLGLDLDQFRQGVLQPAGDGHGPAQGDIHVRQLAGPILRGGIDRGPGLAHHQGAQPQLRVPLDELPRQAVGLPGGGTVADADELDAMGLGEDGEAGDGLIPLVARHMGIEGIRGRHPPGAVHHRHLDPGAQARVQAQGGQPAGGGRQQQGGEIAGEDADGLLLRRLQQARLEVQVETRQQLDPPGLARRLPQPGIRRPAPVANTEVVGHRLDPDRVRVLAGAGDQVQRQHPLVASAKQGEGAVGGDLGQGLAIVEIIRELGALLFLARDEGGAQLALLPQARPQPAREFRVLGEALHEDLPRPFQGGRGIGHPLGGVDEARPPGPPGPGWGPPAGPGPGVPAPPPGQSAPWCGAWA